MITAVLAQILRSAIFTSTPIVYDLGSNRALVTLFLILDLSSICCHILFCHPEADFNL